MNLIDNISDAALQTVHVLLADGSVVDITLRYLPACQRWMMDVTHPTLTLKGKMLANHANLLRQFRNQSPFGLACLTDDGLDPTDQQAFVNEKAALLILQGDDVAFVELNVFKVAGNA